MAGLQVGLTSALDLHLPLVELDELGRFGPREDSCPVIRLPSVVMFVSETSIDRFPAPV
jgi:hypothetical protein